MDLEPVLKAGGVRIADALHRYAEERHWSPEDYRVFMVVNKDWGKFTVEFVARAYDRGATDQDFLDVMHFLEADLKDDPELYRAVGLVLRPWSGYFFLANRRWSSSVEEIPDALINPGVGDVRGRFATSSRTGH